MSSANAASALHDLFATDRDRFVRAIEALDGRAIDEGLVAELDRYREVFHGGKRTVATTDPGRVPGRDEFVVCFGNYPPGFHALPINNPVRRNLLDFFAWDGAFDAVEGHRCWDAVERCFVINLDDRPDRFYSALRELARAGFPLDRIERFAGCVPDDTGDHRLNGQIGCLQSHLAVVSRARKAGHAQVLVLEDDFGFLDDIDRVQDDVARFFQRGYAYDLCLLATSKHGPIEPLDDVVAMTRQPCTNSAGYFLSAPGAERLEACFARALERLLATGETMKFAIDRCWRQLQGERFLVFRRRAGFQLPSFSDIERQMASYFD